MPESKSSKLKQFCATRWVERHDAVLIFYKLQPVIVNALNEKSLWRDVDSSTTTNQLNSSIQQLKFQISLNILVKIFALSSPLSKFHQSENLDLATALNFVHKHNLWFKILEKTLIVNFIPYFRNLKILVINLILIFAFQESQASSQ